MVILSRNRWATDGLYFSTRQDYKSKNSGQMTVLENFCTTSLDRRSQSYELMGGSVAE